MVFEGFSFFQHFSFIFFIILPSILALSLFLSFSDWVTLYMHPGLPSPSGRPFPIDREQVLTGPVLKVIVFGAMPLYSITTPQ